MNNVQLNNQTPIFKMSATTRIIFIAKDIDSGEQKIVTEPLTFQEASKFIHDEIKSKKVFDWTWKVVDINDMEAYHDRLIQG